MESIQDILSEIAHEIYDILGSGHTEAIYQHAFEAELRFRNIQYESQKVVPIIYKNHTIGYGFADIVINDDCETVEQIVIELKAISKLRPQDQTQVLNYMEMLDIKKGYLVNFGAANGVDSITLVV